MSARVISFSDYAPKPGVFSLIVSELPDHGVQTIGVLLLDPATRHVIRALAARLGSSSQ